MADINEEDTVPFDVVTDEDLGLVNREDAESSEIPTEIAKRVPEPALIRGAVVAVLSVVGVVLGVQLDTSWLDPFLVSYAAIAPVVLAWWIRQHVTPVPK